MYATLTPSAQTGFPFMNLILKSHIIGILFLIDFIYIFKFVYSPMQKMDCHNNSIN